MKNNKQSFTDLVADLSSRMYEIKALAELCGFAAEARRVLDEVSVACTSNHAIAVMLDAHVEARNEYLHHADSLALVLKELARKIESANDILNDVEVHDAIRS